MNFVQPFSSILMRFNYENLSCMVKEYDFARSMCNSKENLSILCYTGLSSDDVCPALPDTIWYKVTKEIA